MDATEFQAGTRDLNTRLVPHSDIHCISLFFQYKQDPNNTILFTKSRSFMGQYHKNNEPSDEFTN